MNPQTYKNQWSATEKRIISSMAKKKNKSEQNQKAQKYMARIVAVQLGADHCSEPIYDSCPELIKKIEAFLARDGVTKAAFCRALGNINQNSINPFLRSKNQDKAGNVTYVRAYKFFEKKRVLDGEAKSKRRLKNESEHPRGFLTRSNVGRPAMTLYCYF